MLVLQWILSEWELIFWSSLELNSWKILSLFRVPWACAECSLGGPGADRSNDNHLIVYCCGVRCACERIICSVKTIKMVVITISLLTSIKGYVENRINATRHSPRCYQDRCKSIERTPNIYRPIAFCSAITHTK